MKNCTELNLGKLFYVWLIYHIQDSWLNSLNGYDIYFWLRDTANQPLDQIWQVKYSYPAATLVVKHLSEVKFSERETSLTNKETERTKENSTLN